MRSVKTFVSVGNYADFFQTPQFEAYLLHSALDYGLGDLSSPFGINVSGSVQDPLCDMYNTMKKFFIGENFFSGYELAREISTFRCSCTNNESILIFSIKHLENILPSNFYERKLYQENRINLTEFINEKFLHINKHFDYYKRYNTDQFEISLCLSDLTIYDIIKSISKFMLDGKRCFCLLNDKKYSLVSCNNDINIVNTSQYNNEDNFRDCLYNSKGFLQYDYIIAHSHQSLMVNLPHPDKVPLHVATASLRDADNRRTQLPVLPAECLQDNTLGLWDAYWPEGVEPEGDWYIPAELDVECEAADPWDSLRRDSSVCIDFGTSSTVAAVRESDGGIRLLRIGGDLASLDTSTEYENPTALEFSNYKAMLSPWQYEPWRPLIEWKNIKCSHQAKNELSQGPLSLCGIRNIKTWARARPGQPPLRLHDEQGEAFELSPLPVSETLDGIGDFHERPVDPIELYAYFLGLALNNQSAFGGRIYCDYAMTFPVKFPQEVRRRIRQGFYRGLLRSMPLSLASSPRWKEECPFSLTEQASEPTAFAASVLPYLGIKPTEGGVPFGVFDFGGGTTDFAFGLYRKPTAEESGSEGWERVLDILDVSGDENLGGEHLLDLLAYEVVRAKCGQTDASQRLPEGVTVLCPAGMRPFPGSELLFAESQDAHANMVSLREALRPLWEEGKLADDETGQMRVSLKAQGGAEVSVTFNVDEEALRLCLKQRIREGVLAFFTTFRQAFKLNEIRPQELHVLLAGNSCRSPLVREVFEDVIQTEIAPSESETVPVHYEMIPGAVAGGDADDGNAAVSGAAEAAGGIIPTLKTGVALGLLRLLPGEATGIVERNRKEESPFLFSVGTFSNDQLVPVLCRNAAYGEWMPLGKVFRNGWTLLGYSDSPLAMEKQIVRTQCRECRINWGAENFGRTIFIKAVGPYEAALALGPAGGEGAPDENTLRPLRLER